MKRILKIEFERAFRSKGMLVSLIIGYFIVIVQFVLVVIPKSNNILASYNGNVNTYPSSVFNSWIGMDDLHPYLIIFLTLFPILATLPHAVSYFEDIQIGYIKAVCSRVRRRYYLQAKYIATFIAGGVTVLLPLALNLLLTAAVLPSLIPVGNGLFSVGGGGMYQKIFYTQPYLYTAIYFIMYFVYGGVFASLALAFTHMFDYSFFVLILPFAIYYGLGIISPYLRNETIGDVAPKILLNMSEAGMAVKETFFVGVLLIGLLAYALYMWRGLRHDIF